MIKNILILSFISVLSICQQNCSRCSSPSTQEIQTTSVGQQETAQTTQTSEKQCPPTEKTLVMDSGNEKGFQINKIELYAKVDNGSSTIIKVFEYKPAKTSIHEEIILTELKLSPCGQNFISAIAYDQRGKNMPSPEFCWGSKCNSMNTPTPFITLK